MFSVNRTLLVLLLIILLCLSISGKETIGKIENNDKGKETFELAPVVVLGKGMDYKNGEIEGSLLLRHKVVDLAEILSSELPEVQMIRKSGYGNEVSLRGLGQENIKVLIDEGILEGACGSRKDPALSHINMLTIQEIVVNLGPFDVTKPGYLGGYINIKTKKPVSGFDGEIVSKIGTYDFLSSGFMIRGGDERVKGLLGYNYSASDQYEDGAGNSLWHVREGLAAPYNSRGINADSFKKHDVWGKINILPSDDISLLIEHTYGEARDILTPRVVFDTEKEINNLSKISLSIYNKGSFSNDLTVSIYRNAIEHYPFQGFRNVAAPKNNIVESVITGGSISNMFDTGYADITYGVDIYHRKWWGDVYDSLTGALLNGYLIPTVNSLNMGAYLKAVKRVDKWAFDLGLRYDRFRQEADEELVFTQSLISSNKQTDSLPGGYFMVKYRPLEGLTLFGGAGRTYRTPTSTERYIQGGAAFFGNPALKPASNSEYDIGIALERAGWMISSKLFYSDINDFIYQEHNTAGYQSYRNIDAHITGGDIKFRIDLFTSLSLNGGMAYQRGIKDSFPDNNFDKELGQVAPLKTKLSLDYRSVKPFEIEGTELYSTIEWVHSEDADHIDQDAGEKYLGGWDIVNLRIGCNYKKAGFNIGVENLFNRLYTVANSYEWDVIGGTGANPAIVNEPGRFFYGSIIFNW